jgi:hypothetical protein
MKPKPPPTEHRRELVRVLAAGLARARPGSAPLLIERPERFVLVSWTYEFYHRHRDLALDLPGIERLLENPEPSSDDTRDIDTLARRLSRLWRFLGDALPWLGWLIARPAMRLTMTEVLRYSSNHDGIAGSIRANLRHELEHAAEAGERVLLIAHSLGSVIAYDALWEASQDRPPGGARVDPRVDPRVDLFVTLGSPLATRFIRRRLHGARRRGRDRYPANVRRWVNFSAKGDDTALHPRLRPFFGEMIELGLLESLEDHTGLYNHFRGDMGLNVHKSYGYLSHSLVAGLIADWLAARL